VPKLVMVESESFEIPRASRSRGERHDSGTGRNRRRGRGCAAKAWRHGGVDRHPPHTRASLQSNPGIALLISRPEMLKVFGI